MRICNKKYLNSRDGEVDGVQTVGGDGAASKFRVQNDSEGQIHVGDLGQCHDYSRKWIQSKQRFTDMYTS